VANQDLGDDLYVPANPAQKRRLSKSPNFLPFSVTTIDGAVKPDKQM